jgi:hypothetical protein
VPLTGAGSDVGLPLLAFAFLLGAGEADEEDRARLFVPFGNWGLGDGCESVLDESERLRGGDKLELPVEGASESESESSLSLEMLEASSDEDDAELEPSSDSGRAIIAGSASDSSSLLLESLESSSSDDEAELESPDAGRGTENGLSTEFASDSESASSDEEEDDDEDDEDDEDDDEDEDEDADDVLCRLKRLKTGAFSSSDSESDSALDESELESVSEELEDIEALRFKGFKGCLRPISPAWFEIAAGFLDPELDVDEGVFARDPPEFMDESASLSLSDSESLSELLDPDDSESASTDSTSVF